MISHVAIRTLWCHGARRLGRPMRASVEGRLRSGSALARLIVLFESRWDRTWDTSLVERMGSLQRWRPGSSRSVGSWRWPGLR
jgi:hypothetical protein